MGRVLPSRVLPSRVAWALLVVVAGLALGIGSIHPVAPSRATRIAGLESEIKCPSCADLTIAQSDAAAAVDLRDEVTAMVDSGASDAAVKARVVAQYGTAVLEVPSGGGAGTLVWVLPTAVVAGLVLALGLFLWRRRQPARAAPGRVAPGRAATERGGDGDIGFGGTEDEALVAAARDGRSK